MYTLTGNRHEPGRKNLYRDYVDASPEAKAAAAMRKGFLSEEEMRATEPEDEVQRALFRAARSGNAIGTIERLRKTLQRYEEQHLDTMIFVAQAGDRKHDHIMESIERFGKELLPEFKERHETEHRRWREEQLAGVEYPINSTI